MPPCAITESDCDLNMPGCVITVSSNIIIVIDWNLTVSCCIILVHYCAITKPYYETPVSILMYQCSSGLPQCLL